MLTGELLEVSAVETRALLVESGTKAMLMVTLFY